MKTVSVVLGTYNRLNFLKATVRSIRREIENIDAEIIVVDGGSDDGTIEWLVSQKDIVSIIQHNHGEWNGKKIERKSWGYFMNLGFKAAKGKYICMLSDDCLVIPGAIRNGINLSEKELRKRKRVGAVAFYWRNWSSENKYIVGLTLGSKMFVNHGLYLSSVLEKVGYIDENYDFYHADGDLCLKIWNAGYTCIDSQNSFIEHFSHANRSARKSNLIYQKKDWSRYINKWKRRYSLVTDSDYGGKIEQDFNDTSNTALQFPNGRILSILYNLKKFFRAAFYS